MRARRENFWTMEQLKMTKTKRNKPVVDPMAILEAIAADGSAPATARVAAAKALVALAADAPADGTDPSEDRVLAAALEFLRHDETGECAYKKIPITEEYRGVGIQEWQSPERVDTVKREIDAVYDLKSADALYRFAEESSKSPEARLFAAAKVEALFKVAAQDRTARPRIDLLRLRAVVAGLDSLVWVDYTRHGTIGDASNAVLREIPLNDEMIGRDRLK
jgi:hypothetical protein